MSDSGSKSADYLRYLRGERGAANAAWLTVINRYSPGNATVFAIFEGRDDVAFYLPRIRQRAKNREVVPITVKGKDTVLALVGRVRARVKEPWRALFFVDKDLDDLCGVRSPRDPYLFETECYSIECYLADKDVASIMWDEVFHLPRDQRYDQFVLSFDSVLRQFTQRAQALMGWILCARRMGMKLNLSDLKLGEFLMVDIARNAVCCKGWLSAVVSVAGGGPAPTRGDVRRARIELRPLSPLSYVRGKFVAFILCEFYRKWRAALAKKGTGAQRAVVRVQLTEENLMEVVGARIREPRVLSDFLDRWHGDVLRNMDHGDRDPGEGFAAPVAVG